MKIDIHSHYIPHEFINLVNEGCPELKAKIIEKSGSLFIQHEQGYAYPLNKGFYDLEYRLAEMEKAKIDMAALSSAPPLFYYDADVETSCEVVSLVNDGIAEAVRTYPNKFAGVGNVSLQYVDKAIEQLEYIVRHLGFKAVQIGSNIEGKQLDAPELLPFFAKAEELGVLIITHPYYVGAKNALEKYYLTNLIGNPLDTALAIAHLIFGGVLDKFPALKFCFAHGGGFLPYQIGRLEHGYKVRTEPKIHGIKPPSSYFNQLYFDSILFDERALRYLIEIVEPGQIMMGTDYPFDMGETNPVEFINKATGDKDYKNMILGGNAAEIFGLE